MMDFRLLAEDHGHEVAPRGHKHYRSGWVNVECPFCEGNPGFHLGYNLRQDFFKCWRCGWKSKLDAIMKLLKADRDTAAKKIVVYTDLKIAPKTEKDLSVQPKKTVLPVGAGSLLPSHRDYLISRGFDPEKLEEEWDLRSCGPDGYLENYDYRFRIIAPVYWNGELVSFQGRDVTNKSPMKYKACPSELEQIPHKSIVYGKFDIPRDYCIVVEGITDVWRLGTEAVATFGIEYTNEQARKISEKFKKAFIIFDDEPQAQRKAKELAAELRSRSVWTEIRTIPGDPGDLSQEESNSLISSIRESLS